LPDFSIYRDFPLALQLFQVYKSRAIGVYLEKQGRNVIPNVRWGDSRTFKFAFAGIQRNSVIAVGAQGGYRDNSSQSFFEDGFVEMLKVIQPKSVIVYGNLSNYLYNECIRKHTNIFSFPTEISKRIKQENTMQLELPLFD
jgi:hypothetical protein